MSREHWIQTASGKRFFYDDVTPQQFDVEDMAAGLSRLCRYNGQLKDGPELEDEIYCIAQHSVYVYWFLRDHVPNCPEEALPWALLHDAVEGYYTDMPSPQKAMNPEYKAQEAWAEKMFLHAYGIPYNEEIHDFVKYSDIQILWAESQEMCAIPSDLWDIPGLPETSLRTLDPDFYYWRPKKARAEYMKAYAEISHLIGA
jgi:hypothetical protein